MFFNLKKYFINVHCEICRKEVPLTNAIEKEEKKYICDNCKYKFDYLNSKTDYYKNAFEIASLQEIDKCLLLNKSLHQINLEKEQNSNPSKKEVQNETQLSSIYCNICNQHISIFNKSFQKDNKTICFNCKKTFDRLNHVSEYFKENLFNETTFEDIYDSIIKNESIREIYHEREYKAYQEKWEKIKSQRKQNYINYFNNLKHLDLKLSKNPAKKGALKDIFDFSPSSVTKNTPDLKLDNFVAIDTETTGLSATKNEIIEIAAIKFEEGEPIECLHTLIKPKIEISDEIININHITNEMVENAPKIEFVIEAFNEFIENYNIVAYNTEFDIKFLHKNGMDFFSTKRTFFDAMQVCRKYYDKNSISNYKLDTVCKKYGIERFENHRALEDALATGIIFNDLSHKIKLEN